MTLHPTDLRPIRPIGIGLFFAGLMVLPCWVLGETAPPLPSSNLLDPPVILEPAPASEASSPPQITPVEPDVPETPAEAPAPDEPPPTPPTSTESVFQARALTLDNMDRVSYFPGKKTAPLHYGMWNVWPGARAEWTFDDNPGLRQNGGRSETVFRFTPTLQMETTGHVGVYIRYAPTFAWHFHDTTDFTLDHDFLGGLNISWSKLSLKLEQSYQRLTGSSVEFGGSVDRDISETRLTARYRLTEKTHLVLGAGVDSRSFSGGADSTGEHVEPLISYRLWRHWNFEFGARFGLEQVSGGPEQRIQQPKIRLVCDPTPRLSFQAEAGYEFREIENNQDFAEPSFLLGTSYRLREGTTVTLDASHGLRVSDAYGNQVVTSTIVRAEWRQQLNHRCDFSLSGGYSTDDYQQVSSSSSGSSRTDQYFFARTQLGIPIGRTQSLAVYYLRRQQDSTLQSSDFENNQVGLLWSLNF